ERSERDVAGVGTRFDLWRAVVLHGIPEAKGRELSWLLEETPVLSRFRRDLPATARSAVYVLSEENDRASEEHKAVRRLWSACVKAVRRAGEPPVTPVVIPVRHRDCVQMVCGLDTDGWIHPPLIRFLAGYLDQGLAHWPMPGRQRGIHGCFLEIYGTSLAALCGADDECEVYLSAELLALRGWAGIVRQIEERPDRVPARDLTVTLRGYLASRLLFERAARDEAARQLSFRGSHGELRGWLRHQLTAPSPPTAIER